MKMVPQRRRIARAPRRFTSGLMSPYARAFRIRAGLLVPPKAHRLSGLRIRQLTRESGPGWPGAPRISRRRLPATWRYPPPGGYPPPAAYPPPADIRRPATGRKVATRRLAATRHRPATRRRAGYPPPGGYAAPAPAPAAGAPPAPGQGAVTRPGAPAPTYSGPALCLSPEGAEPPASDRRPEPVRGVGHPAVGVQSQRPANSGARDPYLAGQVHRAGQRGEPPVGTAGEAVGAPRMGHRDPRRRRPRTPSRPTPTTGPSTRA